AASLAHRKGDGASSPARKGGVSAPEKMKVAQKAVRVYSSNAYTAPTVGQAKISQPIVIEPFPLDGMNADGRALVYLGAPVAWVKETLSIRQAVGSIILNLFVGLSPDHDSNQAIRAALVQNEGGSDVTGRFLFDHCARARNRGAR